VGKCCIICSRPFTGGLCPVVPVWLSGNCNALFSINRVAVLWARLLLGSVTLCGQYRCVTNYLDQLNLPSSGVSK